MELIKHNHELVRDIIPFELNDNVHKLPEMVYQILFNMTQSFDGIGTKQGKILKVLREYVEEKFPGETLNTFIDLNNRDVEEVFKRTGTRLEWGMYYTTQPIINHPKLLTHEQTTKSLRQEGDVCPGMRALGNGPDSP
jgi:hypothetical protein